MSGGTCTGQLAAAVFPQALCSCRSLDLSPDLVTDRFDSRVGSWRPDGGGGGTVGVNSALRFPGSLDIGGDLIVASGIEGGPRLNVTGALRIASSLGRSDSRVQVGGSAEIGGDVDVSTLDVGGTLTMPSGVTAGETITASERVTGTVAVERPCRCSPDGGVDVAGLFQQHRAGNDDAALGLSPSAYSSFGGDETLSLTSAVVYLDRVHSRVGGALALQIAGHVVVFIDATDAKLKVQLADGAALDLFINGPVSFAPGALGSPTHPSALRIFSANAGTIDLTDVQLSAFLYAPTSDVTADVAHEVFGGLVVGRVTGGWGDRLVIHHDEAITALEGVCEQ
jgi:hypothetical protein